ncbi:YlxQ family RNA-binding protein [Virgibacillus halodenitrificans]|jgi:ribosomal protein L7Ae-like RNA K-turn-binding protein|uniref:50S ribosomal protein L7ae n=1 Tax=Virgibacillus halodenitrificans TaxID=1482 RepID=A0AAC9NL39_VIRHA|nr:YlxQ family RNA-binding protein [Virgibacillus halodenitrificans]APC48593.1 50S ribosomal protein L7ae [Virgibacillus halodenitrificans]MBD1224204.1 YlxQ family RNA-binding protein [Virgibacillus halodenitrificans]MCG1028739.1 YlxQ family RNA-binding protein [Virgibacillus halodenitrificans]MCJ0931167.1 YlxQ family RNA-binding protein [Virgibacillus halodenitrificans]MYL46001.1 YlxQ family RNA-binding protein [Virgibacillus halodenitrificans]
MRNSYLNMIGLAYRARKCSLGEETIVKDIQQKKAKLVLVASDIGPQTKKKITDKCKTYKVPFEIVDDRETLSHAIGKSQRVAVAILDAGFAEKIKSLLG